MGWVAAGAVGLMAAGTAAFWPRAPEAPAPTPVASVAALVSCSAPQVRDCTFYASCVERNVPCGPSGYAIGFGERYCNKFKAAQLSPTGTAWASSVMLCLERSLVPYTTPEKKSASCEQISQAAFDSHAACYTQPEASICFLPPPDVMTVFDTISADELLAPRTLPQIEAVSATCVGQLTGLEGDGGHGHWPTPFVNPDGDDAGPTLAERRAFWENMRDKYKNKSPR
jgi:hypothetical protein